jgi:hypothetical protein
MKASMAASRIARWLPAGRWRISVAILLGLHAARLLCESFRTDPAIVFPSAVDFVALKADEMLRSLFSVLVYAGFLACIERLADVPGRKAAALVLMLSGAVLGTLAMAYLPPWEPVAVRLGASASTQVWFWYALWMNMLVGVIALVVVENLRERQRALERLAERQERGRVVRQQLAYAQLQAIQARVDPQLLFDMLGTVKRYYEHDAARAEALLDELTAFLRAALPRLRSARSSLEAEFGLVICYVRMLRAAGDAAIALKAALPAALEHAVFPAGLLLPLLVRPLAGHAAREIVLDAQGPPLGPAGMLRVRVSDTDAPDTRTVERLRASVSDLYGEQATLRVPALGEPGAWIELEVPHERE